MWKTQSVEEAIERYNFTLNEWVEGVFTYDYLVCLGPLDGKNFRDDLWPLYKQTASRVSGRGTRPDHQPAFKGWVYDQKNTVIADNIEADDLLGIYSNQVDSVIISVDKDLNQLEGFHYNPNQGGLYYQDEVGSKKFLLEQLVKGDPIDKIPGIPGMGDKKARAYLEPAGDNVPQAAAMVQDLYTKTYGEEAESALLFNGKLLYLMRKDYDWFTMKTFQELFTQGL
jgi:5'-3' exonuclease